ncbi:MAG: hypothetical protein BGO01_00620 [Armatimonadetes bacterium 55-13]|nr:MAG: hypothetical protein BGO01_00620 [Armatimonadetes bacterium 55-13]
MSNFHHLATKVKTIPIDFDQLYILFIEDTGQFKVGKLISIKVANLPITISPSDLTFLWEECQACFWDKYRLGLRRPRPVMPAIFNVIDMAIKETLSASTLDTTVRGAPICSVIASDVGVVSIPMSIGGAVMSIKGILDSLVRYQNGKIGVIDYKTSSPVNAERTYSAQLDAYVYALKNPEFANGPYPAQSISNQSGLIFYEPDQLKTSGTGLGALIGSLTWYDLPYSENRHITLMTEVGSILSGPRPPSGKRCDVCRYFNQRLG